MRFEDGFLLAAVVACAVAAPEVARAGEDPVALFNRGVELAGKKQWKEAVDIWDGLAGDLPEKHIPTWHLYLGMGNKELGRLPESWYHFTAYLASAKDDAQSAADLQGVEQDLAKAGYRRMTISCEPETARIALSKAAFMDPATARYRCPLTWWFQPGRHTLWLTAQGCDGNSVDFGVTAGDGPGSVPVQIKGCRADAGRQPAAGPEEEDRIPEPAGAGARDFPEQVQKADGGGFRSRVLAVLPIEDPKALFKAEDLESAGDFLRTTIARGGQVAVIDKGKQEEKRKALLAALKKDSHQVQVDDAYRLQLGKELAADTLLLCTVGAVGKTCTLTCELLPVEKAAAVGGATAEFPCTPENLLAGVKSVAADFAAPSKGASAALAAPSARDSTPLRSSSGIALAWIPEGCFLMGSPENEPERKTEERQHKVCLSQGFYMAATEVTQGQWDSVMSRNPSQRVSAGPDVPVENVTFDEALEFCNKLSDADRLERCYDTKAVTPRLIHGCTGYRLPTEAQWEYAARAGTTTPFATGRCLDSTEQANYDGRYPLSGCDIGRTRGKTEAAGTFAANPWGLVDMSGNVAEWVWDYFADYPMRSLTDPEGPSAGTGRVIRGGSYNSPAVFCRSADRQQGTAGFRSPDTGFRVVRSGK
jgi:formylglycine-generating enzyme required for sulfatase activity